MSIDIALIIYFSITIAIFSHMIHFNGILIDIETVLLQGTCASASHVPFVHCIRIYASYLGQVH